MLNLIQKLSSYQLSGHFFFSLESDAVAFLYFLDKITGLVLPVGVASISEIDSLFNSSLISEKSSFLGVLGLVSTFCLGEVSVTVSPHRILNASWMMFMFFVSFNVVNAEAGRFNTLV